MKKSLILLLMVLLLQSCASNRSLYGENIILNNSALYDPPTVSLIKGENYHFQEGWITGTGQKFHSDFSFQRAVQVGNRSIPMD